MGKIKTKSLDDIMADMSGLYEEVRAGKTELKVASELANISGKYLKAYQLKLATEIFAAGDPGQPRLKQVGGVAVEIGTRKEGV